MTRLPETYGDALFDDPKTPLYLTGCSTPGTRSSSRTNLGLLIQPGNSTHRDAGAYPLVGVDNGCFAKGDRFDLEGWLTWLRAEVTNIRHAVFVACPDVVGDAVATLERSAPVFPLIREMGLVPALVAQDGLEDLEVPWDEFDALFIGGSTDWKLSDAAAELAAEARSRGQWVHMGRVNSWKRFKRAAAMGCDSVDGTFVKFSPAENLPRLEVWLDRLDEAAA